MTSLSEILGPPLTPMGRDKVYMSQPSRRKSSRVELYLHIIQRVFVRTTARMVCIYSHIIYCMYFQQENGMYKTTIEDFMKSACFNILGLIYYLENLTETVTTA